MPKYIDAEKYANTIRDAIADSYQVSTGKSSMPKERLRAFEDVIEDLENMEDEDVAPVIHARWKLVGGDDDLNSYYQCPNCHIADCKEEWFYIYGMWKPFQYCPYCGAKMKSEGE